MTYLPQIRILVPGAQVSDYTTGNWQLAGHPEPFVFPQNASRGFFAGGVASATPGNVIDYIDISTLGNATDFGDLTTGTNKSHGGGSSTRGIIVLGVEGVNQTASNKIEYITIASTGNSTSFGTRTATADSSSGVSSSTRMVSLSGPTYVDDYITIASLGNSTDFGATWSANAGDENVCTAGSPTRGLFAGGYKNASPAGAKFLIQYITIATTGTISDFGNLVTNNGGYSGRGGTSNGVRAVFKNEFNNATMEYVTIASVGNGTVFGDLSFGSYNLSAGDCSNGTKGIFAGSLNDTNVIQYVNVNSTGNSLDFGDLTVGRNGPASSSSGHGGL